LGDGFACLCIIFSINPLISKSDLIEELPVVHSTVVFILEEGSLILAYRNVEIIDFK